MTAADYDFLLALRMEAMGIYVEKIYGWNKAYHQNYFKKSFNPHDMKIIQFGGVDVGMCYVVEQDDCHYIKRIEVLPEYQNGGIGTAALRQILKRAEQQNKSIKLRVFKINPAQRLYERHGFQIIGETDTHFYMERPTTQ